MKINIKKYLVLLVLLGLLNIFTVNAQTVVLSGLPPFGGTISGSDIVPMTDVDANTTYKVTLNEISLFTTTYFNTFSELNTLVADETLAKASDIGVTLQGFDADLSLYGAITPAANTQSLLGAADYAAWRTLLDLEAGTDFYSIAAADAAFATAAQGALWTTSGADLYRASGNVGIGAVPVAKLDVKGDLYLKNSTTATQGRIYKTYTDASNGEWLSLDWATTDIATIKPLANGTGTFRALRLESLNKRFLHQGGAGLYNTFLGNDSGNYSVSGDGNTGIGLQAAKGLTSGTYNTAIGIFALEDETTGSFSTAVGRSALANQNGATSNTAMGRSAGALLSTGSYNIILGALALDAETTGGSNIAIGYQALSAQNGVSGSVAIGHQAGQALLSGGQNTIVGYAALDAETSGSNNVAVGFSALSGQNGATYNTAVGRSAGILLSTGSNNTILGALAGDNLTTGTSNIIIGYNIDAQSTTANGQISIGNLIFGTAVGAGTAVSTGNVGIGVVAPITKLDVKGDVAVKNGTSAVEQTIYNTYTDASNYEGLEIGFKDSLNVATIKTTANGTGTVRPIVFATGGTERIRINANGKIGVGTTAPTYLYQQDTANGTENWIGIRQSAQALWSMGLKAGDGTFHVRSGNGGSEIDHMSITYTTGNVGIGNTTPSYKLDVAGDSIFGDNTNGIAIRFHDSHGGSVSAGIGSLSSNSSVKDLAFYVASTTEFEAMRINYLGNVGIGTASPGSKLDVAGGVTLRDRSAMTATAAQSKIWSEAGEMKVIDAAGNITTISPHPQELMDVLGVTGAAKTLGMDYTTPESGLAVAQPKARWLEWYVEIDHATGAWTKRNFNGNEIESGQSNTLVKIK